MYLKCICCFFVLCFLFFCIRWFGTAPTKLAVEWQVVRTIYTSTAAITIERMLVAIITESILKTVWQLYPKKATMKKSTCFVFTVGILNSGRHTKRDPHADLVPITVRTNSAVSCGQDFKNNNTYLCWNTHYNACKLLRNKFSLVYCSKSLR